MRPIWKGSISFGLVYIPVAVYPATREEKLSFRQLRSSDLSPIRYKKVADSDSKEVPANEIVKGFEYEKGRYVVLKDEDFELPSKAVRGEILQRRDVPPGYVLGIDNDRQVLIVHELVDAGGPLDPLELG